MRIEEANDLLKPGYLPFETGYTRLDNGQMLVAALHQVHGCTGEMLGWWFARDKSLEEFKQWHPVEHVDWRTARGISWPVHKRGEELLRGRTRARRPGDYLDETILRQSGVSFVSCGQLAPADGEVWTGLIIHVGRDTEYGCEVKSRFWLGAFDPVESTPPPDVLNRMFPEARGEQLLQHTIEEFHYLAGFLPDLYAEERLTSEPL